MTSRDIVEVLVSIQVFKKKFVVKLLRVSFAERSGLLKCLQVMGNKCTATQSLGLANLLPLSFKVALAGWGIVSVNGLFPPMWKNSNSSGGEGGTLATGTHPEAYLQSVVRGHVSALTGEPSESQKALKHCMTAVATFAMDLFFWPESFRSFRAELSELFFPLVMDGCMEDMHELVIKIPHRIMGGTAVPGGTLRAPSSAFQDTDEFQEKVGHFF